MMLWESAPSLLSPLLSIRSLSVCLLLFSKYLCLHPVWPSASPSHLCVLTYPLSLKLFLRCFWPFHLRISKADPMYPRDRWMCSMTCLFLTFFCLHSDTHPVLESISAVYTLSLKRLLDIVCSDKQFSSALWGVSVCSARGLVLRPTMLLFFCFQLINRLYSACSAPHSRQKGKALAGEHHGSFGSFRVRFFPQETVETKIWVNRRENIGPVFDKWPENILNKLILILLCQQEV